MVSYLLDVTDSLCPECIMHFSISDIEVNIPPEKQGTIFNASHFTLPFHITPEKLMESSEAATPPDNLKVIEN